MAVQIPMFPIVEKNEVGRKLFFARHETFHPRFGWLKKGFEAAQRVDEQILVQDDAHLHLGVGKNMAYAIRYWCSAFKLISHSNRANQIEPTAFGKNLLGIWDPYLEDPASLWLLHWNLLRKPCEATAWYYVFNEFNQAEFSVDDLFHGLCKYRDNFGSHHSDSSLRKDIQCLLRMFSEQPRRATASEETIDCPFVELGLVRPAGDSRHFGFNLGAKLNLPPEIIVATCLEYTAEYRPNQRTIATSRLIFDKGSPGMAFKISESDLCYAIERVHRNCASVTLSDAGGLVQMSFQSEPKGLATQLLDSYYAKESVDVQ